MLSLDIDGVLNSQASLLTLGDSGAYNTNFNKVSVLLIDNICKLCDLKVYIHSNWVKSVKLSWIRRKLKSYGTNFEILDNKGLLRLSDERVSRIKFAIRHYRPEKYVILDDQDLTEYFGSSFIWVDPCNGFSYYEYLKILEHFNVEPPEPEF